MTCNRSNNIEKILREIDGMGYASRQSYHYEMNESGEIIKVDPFKRPCISVYATREDVEEVRESMKARNW